MDDASFTRREVLRLGAAGAMAGFMRPEGLSGLAAEYDRYDALGLAELVARKEITPLELLHAVRQRVESLQPRLNCFSALFFDKAEAQIEAGLPDGSFRGVPFALKDISHQLKGTATTNGSRLFRDNVPDFDSTLVERYKKAGLVLFGKTTSPELGLSPSTESVLFGKTTTPEFGWKGVTDSPLTGITRNPWNPRKTPGGSSGGSAAAVAAGMGALTVGTDGGGSIRIPCAFTGLFGL